MIKRIMVVDDSRLVRVQLGDVLEGTDYEIAAYCRSGEDLWLMMIRLSGLRLLVQKGLWISRFIRSNCLKYLKRHCLNGNASFFKIWLGILTAIV